MSHSTHLTTPFMEANWLENDILSIKSLPSKSLDAKSYLKHYDLFADFMNGNERCKILIDFTQSVSVPNSIKKPMKAHIDRHAKQIAVYSKNPLGVTIAQLTLVMTKPKVPTKVFRDKTKALEWLKTMEESPS